MSITRRDFVCKSSRTAITVAFLSHLLQKNALAKVPKFSWEKWISALQDASSGLISAKLSPGEWQVMMGRIYASAPLDQLARYINVPALLRNTEVGESGEKFVFTPLTDQGITEEARRVLITKAAVVSRGRSIPPHGHENMVSAFLTLHGRFLVRQYDKLETTKTSMVIKPLPEQIQLPGQWSSISDEHRNCHTLKALGEDALLFSTKITQVKPDIRVRGRVYFDLSEARPMATRYLQVPIVSREDAFSKN